MPTGTNVDAAKRLRRLALSLTLALTLQRPRLQLLSRALCRLTQPAIDFQRLEIRDCQNWIWQVHENQAYLGRTVLRLRRRSFGSLGDLLDLEWLRLREEIKFFEAVMREVFQPDRFNYSQLGNTFPQLHLHAVPRYRSKREWGGVVFMDSRWGANWAPSAESPLMPEQVYSLADWLRAKIEAIVPPGDA
jgi:diadenosine tetraphosphate (Ap4A) HIT family hydrolase